MVAAERVTVILLAAGLSRRFGAGDKLVQPLDGLPLGLHAARTLASIRFGGKIAVTRGSDPDYRAYGFATVVNPDPAGGQSGSIRRGLALARRYAPQAVLVALADMPFVTVAHVEALMRRMDDRDPIVASTQGGLRCPPALFDASRLDALDALRGDAGARSLLVEAATVEAPIGALADIDTLADFPKA